MTQTQPTQRKRHPNCRDYDYTVLGESSASVRCSKCSMFTVSHVDRDGQTEFDCCSCGATNRYTLPRMCFTPLFDRRAKAADPGDTYGT